jgi:hypothetical protein
VELPAYTCPGRRVLLLFLKLSFTRHHGTIASSLFYGLATAVAPLYSYITLATDLFGGGFCNVVLYLVGLPEDEL